jgi:hypothetical protein
VESGSVTPSDGPRLRWDLLESNRPQGERLTVRLAVPSRCEVVFLALDEAGKRYVLVQLPDKDRTAISERVSRGIEVQTVEFRVDRNADSAVFIEIACLDSSGYAVLDLIVHELVEAIEAGKGHSRGDLVQGILVKWKRFWSGVQEARLSREQQLGLFGELWFLARWLIPSVGADRAVPMWRGPSGARNDFEGPRLAVEVKTSSRVDGSHQIHGLEQLVDPSQGELLLFSLLVRDEASGTEALPRLVGDLRKTLTAQSQLLMRFESALFAAGYEDAQAREYEKLNLRVRGQGLYKVSSEFPRLVPDSLRSPIPAGVSDVVYLIRLDGAGACLISDSPTRASGLLKDLVTAGDGI